MQAEPSHALAAQLYQRTPARKGQADRASDDRVPGRHHRFRGRGALSAGVQSGGCDREVRITRTPHPRALHRVPDQPRRDQQGHGFVHGVAGGSGGVGGGGGGNRLLSGLIALYW